jgi:hypothetical protein
MVKPVRSLFPHRVALATISALGLSGCGGIEVPQFRTPRWDPTVFVAPNASQFARKDAALVPVSAGDLVDASGNCAGAPQAQSESEQAAPALFARNVTLQMTECEVVRSLGPPASVQIGANERGDRKATITYASAERPTYVFIGGRLSSIERGAEPPPEPARKKPAPRRQPA